ncbi:MAG: cation-translocating P-type ATPase [Chloroflexi bacterium]|nr:cation-translocating P-type ATPase [Chloroflexota bacterium]MCC6893634.1 cation-translocating P-type ATPase [Anaerolineae bacterium]
MGIKEATLDKAGRSTATSTTSTWHVQEAADVLHTLNVKTAQGLDSTTVTKRLETYGANELVEKGITSPWAILWEQMTNPLVLLLLLAAGISLLLGKVDSVVAIMAIVVLNAVLGVFQEYRAEQAMAALKKMAAPLVRVRREGKLLDITSRDVVPGDMILLEAGSIVPADARITESANLQVQESSLTGESQPVEKSIIALRGEDIPLGDRHNMLYMGTAVTYGRGEAVVVETGMKTQLGRIAELIQSVEGEVTPLQRRINELGKALLILALVVMGIAFIIGLTTGDALEDVLLNAVAIAVAVVPEGLPAVVTVALALGAQRMLKRKALIRKLPAVETLGSVTTICSDKTGTLTENKMTVTIVDIAGRSATIDEVVKRSQALGALNGTGMPEPQDTAQALLLAGNTLANDAMLEGDPLTGFKAVGDPTEGALIVAAARFGIEKPSLDKMFPRVGEVPFSSERKRMSTVHKLNNELPPNEGIARYLKALMQHVNREYIIFTKGAVDSLLDVSDRAWIDGEIIPMTPEVRARIEQSNNELAKKGLRVLGMSVHRIDNLPAHWTPEEVEKNMVFVGMEGIIDPPRPEVRDAVAKCRTAGIRPVMITGDHPLTALNIARDLGIATEQDTAMTGQELDKLSQQELESVVERVPVYARVSPENKLQIVQALQNKGHVVAMTGDGVNDAPALKRANIGVAMGITGTAVSKEAADMVIVDDNFATIVSAVEEGRTIYDNVRRFVKYLMASNTGELFVLLATQLIAGMGLPLTTLQILWMNLITDGIPALALGVEKAERGGMNRSPYAPNESIFGRGLARHIVIVGIVLGVSGLLLGLWAFNNYQNGVATFSANTWNTMVFFFLTVAQMGHALGLRSHRESTFSIGFTGNKMLLGAVVVTIVLQLIAVYLPFFNRIFNTTPLTVEQLLICIVLSTIVFWAVEIEKWLIRRGILN